MSMIIYGCYDELVYEYWFKKTKVRNYTLFWNTGAQIKAKLCEL